MLKLGMPSEPFWLDLVSGAKVKVRPLEMALYHASRAHGWKDAEAAAKVTRDAEGKLSADTDFLLLNSLFNGFCAQHLARYAVVEWDGVQAEDGTPAECTPDNAAKLMLIPAAGSKFLDAYTATVAAVIVEGNA